MPSSYVGRHIASRAAALALVCSLGPSAAACARKPVTHTVTIDASRFDPAVLTVTAGDTVVWVNNDIIPHTANSQVGHQGFASGSLALGQSWTYRPKQAGEWAYVCAFHPAMKATLVVK
jgi:plastocyanin